MRLSRRGVIGIIVAAVIILVGVIVYISLIPKAYLTFAVAPDKVNVSIDKATKIVVHNRDKIQVTPGHHTIEVTQDEFSSYSSQIDIKNGESQEYLVALDAQTDKAQALLNNDISQAVIQLFHGKKFTSETTALTDKNPILSILPIQARLYKVYACSSVKYPSDITKIAICVDLYHTDLEPYVKKDITSRGFNLDDQEVIWNDLYSAGE